METYRARKTPSAPQGRKTAPAGKPSGRKPAGKRAPALSPEEAKRKESARRLAAQRRREEKRRIAALRKRRRQQLFRLCFSLSLVFVILYWCYVAVAIHTRVKPGEEVLPLMVFTDGEREEDKTYPAKEIFRGGAKYLAITDLSPYITVTQFGDGKTRSFQLPGGEYATFYLGSEEAVINSVHVSLSAPAMVVGEDLCLPVDFFGDKMTCFDYKESVSTYGADVLTFLSTDPGFYFHPSPQCETVSFETVPVAPTLPEGEVPEGQTPAEGQETPEQA